jgi:hypothetical protein
LMARTGDGQETPAYSGVDITWGYASQGPAVVARGTLSLNLHDLSRPLLTVCPDACWYQPGMALDCSAVATEDYYPYVGAGVPVDITGEIIVSDMLIDADLVATQILPTPGGRCVPVAVQEQSWGRLKSNYR